ncbi:MAG: nucleotidyl transferase AbiEii/AbiGii toxin family protein [Asticcacaulis sp.]
MTTGFAHHFDSLPLAQQALWPDLAAITRLGFVLYGGTAIALRLGHRISVDFDFFHDQPLDKPGLYKQIAFLGTSTVIQDQPDGLTVLVEREALPVKVSFLAPVRFGRIGMPQATRDRVLMVASLDDLIATKLKVILQRAEAKDYLDIHAMLVAGANLATGLAGARVLFGSTFQPSESLKALTFFGEGDLHNLPLPVKQNLLSAASRVGDLPGIEVVSRSLGL